LCLALAGGFGCGALGRDATCAVYHSLGGLRAGVRLWGAEISGSENSVPRQARRNHPPGIRTRLRSLGLKPETVAIDAGLSVHEVAAILDAWEEDLRRGEVGTGALTSAPHRWHIGAVRHEGGGDSLVSVHGYLADYRACTCSTPADEYRIRVRYIAADKMVGNIQFASFHRMRKLGIFQLALTDHAMLAGVAGSA